MEREMERYVATGILGRPLGALENEWASISMIAREGRRRVCCGGTLKKITMRRNNPMD